MLATLFGFLKVNLFFGAFLAAIIPFCISFFLLDLNSAIYGSDSSKKIIKYTLNIRLIIASLIYLIIQPLTIYPDYFDSVVRGMFSGYIAGYLGYFLNIYLFSKINYYFEKRHLWLNVLIATSTGELLYSIISNTLFMLTKFNVAEIMSITINGFWFKLLFEIATLPILYFLVYYLLEPV